MHTVLEQALGKTRSKAPGFPSNPGKLFQKPRFWNSFDYCHIFTRGSIALNYLRPMIGIGCRF
jgi:hypothetical protein